MCTTRGERRLEELGSIVCGGSLVDFFGKVHKMLKSLSQQNVTKIYHAVHPNGQTDSSSPLCIPVSRQSQNGKV